jgi:uncharacterized protein with von Willebrand factor type A (vWA) domain
VRARFSRWDATQDPLGPDPDVGGALDDMADDLLSGSSPRRALRDLLRRGVPGGARGLDDLLRRLRARRHDLAGELDLSAPLREIARELDEVVRLEREALTLLDTDEARTKEALLGALPDSPAATLAELGRYDFASEDARGRFEALLEKLRREALDATLRGLASALENLSPEQLARTKDMLAELNAMLAARAGGESVDFGGFMSRYGDLFPERPSTLDELIEALARRARAASRLVASLTPEQRAELTRLSTAAVDDVDLEWQLDELGRALRSLRPDLAWDEAVEAGGEGEEYLPLSATLEALERVSELDELERQVAGDYPGASLEDIDVDALRRALDADAVTDLDRLRALERALSKGGILERRAGRLQLTARGARLLGERSLTRLLSRIGREPTHHAPGGQAEPTGATRPWAFGDAEAISVQRTVFNAVARTTPGEDVRLSVDDFEVIETESRPRTATALLLDLSYSMPIGGHWVPAKRMALALAALIEGKYPQDELFLIGFSDYAREMTPVDLACAGWENVHGTNMHHALLLARRRLGEARGPIKQVIMVTDGEPTAHLDEHGGALFNWPPVRETVEKTLREAARLARSGIAINVFMLERTPGLVAFMDRLARLTRGQVVPAHSPDLEMTVIGDYVRRRAGR